MLAGHPGPLVSGHRAPRVYGPLAQTLAAGLEADRPDLAACPEAIAAWSTAEAVAALLRRHLAEVGPVDPATSQPRETSLHELHRAESAAARHRAVLGLDPRSEAALARERAEVATLVVDLDGLAERGRQALQAREQAGLPAPIDLAGEALARAHAEGEAERERQALAWVEAQPDRAAARKAAKEAKRQANREAWRNRHQAKANPSLRTQVPKDAAEKSADDHDGAHP